MSVRKRKETGSGRWAIGDTRLQEGISRRKKQSMGTKEKSKRGDDGGMQGARGDVI